MVEGLLEFLGESLKFQVFPNDALDCGSLLRRFPTGSPAAVGAALASGAGCRWQTAFIFVLRIRKAVQGSLILHFPATSRPGSRAAYTKAAAGCRSPKKGGADRFWM